MKVEKFEMIKVIIGKFVRLGTASFCFGLLANAAAAQCGPDGMQRCPEKDKPLLSKPVARIKSAVTGAAKPILPKTSARANIKNAKAEAAAKIAEAEKYYDYAINGCGDADNQCKVVNFTRAIELNPRYADAYGYRGYIYTLIDKKNEAVRDFTKAVELNPRDAVSFYNRGVTFYNLQNFDAALRDYTKAIEINPGYTSAYLSRAEITQQKFGASAALNDYNQAVKSAPNSFATYHLRGIFYSSHLNDQDAALRDLTKSIQLMPLNFKAYHWRAKIYEKKNLLKEASDDYTTILKLKPTADIYVERGLLSQKRGDQNGALADFNQAIRMDSTYAYAYFCRAYLLATMPDSDQAALRDYTKAIELFPRYTAAYVNRAVLYSKFGDNDRALKDYTTAIQVDPAFAVAYKNRAVVYRRLGLTSFAEADEKKYKQLRPVLKPLKQ